MRLECITNTLLRTFEDFSSMSSGIKSMLSHSSHKYDESMQKFSVLTYDYLERIDNLSKREALLQAELDKQSTAMQSLKEFIARQAEHIKAQNAFILKQKA